MEEEKEQYDGNPIPGASALFISQSGKKFSTVSESATGHYTITVPIPMEEPGTLYVTAEGYETK